MGRLFAALVVIACAGYLLQVDDSALTTSGVASPADYFPAVNPGSGDRDFYAAHRAVVPFGRATLELPILMYHYIRVPPSMRSDLIGYNLSVAPEVFAAQMDWLASHGYHTITFDDVRLYWEREAPLPSRPVIITLDDGYQDLYSTAFPILLAHDFTAVAYIVTAFVGRPGYVTADEIVRMDRYGLEVGAHTVNHADLARASQPWLTYQLVESKRWLERLVGHPVLDMAYPSGKFNAQTVAAVERAGYYSAVTEQYSILHTQADRYQWARVRVPGGEPMSVFVTSLGVSMPTVKITRISTEPDRLALLQQA